MTSNHRLLIASLALATLPASAAGEFTPVAERPEIQSSAISEASGLAVSPTNPHFMWVINDSGGTPDLHLMGIDGTDRGSVTLLDANNVDWEDLASFTLDGKSFLLVADTGDNHARHESSVFYIVREPELPALGAKLKGATRPAWQIQFRYEGGPRDCEAAAVDAVAEKIIFISKRQSPPEVFELPLRTPKSAVVQTARKLSQTSVPSPAAKLIPFSNQPTGLDISQDRSLAAVITYYGVFLFPRHADETWAEALAKPPVVLQPHLLAQAESVAFSKDGGTIYAISEGRKSPIVRYQRRAEASIPPAP